MLTKILSWISIVFNTLYLVPQIAVQSMITYSSNVSSQVERVAELEDDYASGSYTPVNEADFCDFDLAAALGRGVKLNDVQFIGTHNSYKNGISDASRKFCETVLVPLGFANEGKYSYAHETLTDQLNKGVRSLELDAMYDGNKLRCCHIGFYDTCSSCIDLGLAFKEIALWSRANPGHLPVTILIECKANLLVGRSIYRLSDMKSVGKLDSLTRESFGDILYTPADMLGSYSDFAALRADGGMPELKDTLGKVIAILHPSKLTDDYVATDPTLRSQSMFPATENPDKPYALFLLANTPGNEIRGYVDSGYFVRTRLDTDNIHTEERLLAGIASGANVLSTDFPPKFSNAEGDYEATIDGYTVSLNTDIK